MVEELDGAFYSYIYDHDNDGIPDYTDDDDDGDGIPDADENDLDLL